MSTKLELLISDIIVRSYSKCSNSCPFRPTRTCPETSSPFVDYLIDNGLLQARPDLDQALLQLIHIFHRLLVYMMLYTAPNAVVDRVEVEAVGRPAVRRDERWCFTTRNSTVARARRMEMFLGLCPSKGTAV